MGVGEREIGLKEQKLQNVAATDVSHDARLLTEYEFPNKKYE